MSARSRRAPRRLCRHEGAAQRGRLSSLPRAVRRCRVTAVEVFSHTDVTDAPLLPPVTAGRGAADFCAGGHRAGPRLDRIEQGLQSPVSITYATLAAARADNVSATVSTLEIRGGSFAEMGRGRPIVGRPRQLPQPHRPSSSPLMARIGRASTVRPSSRILGQDARDLIDSKLLATFTDGLGGSFPASYLRREREYIMIDEDDNVTGNGTSIDTAGIQGILNKASASNRPIRNPTTRPSSPMPHSW